MSDPFVSLADMVASGKGRGVTYVEEDFGRRLAVIVRTGERTARREIDLASFSGMRIGREASIKAAVVEAEVEARKELEVSNG